jgi:hypothetical protein
VIGARELLLVLVMVVCVLEAGLGAVRALTVLLT